MRASPVELGRFRNARGVQAGSAAWIGEAAARRGA